MEGPLSKKSKQTENIDPAKCVICSGEACFAKNKELLAKCVIRHLIPPTERETFSQLPIFDFCFYCIEILEDLIQWQFSLEFIQETIRKKSTDIKLKILKNQVKTDNADLEAFRRMSTREFLPCVQLCKNNKSIPPKETKKKQQSNVNQIGTAVNLLTDGDHEKRDSRLTMTKEVQTDYIWESNDNFNQCDPLLLLESSPEDHPNQNRGKYSDDKIVSEIIAIQPKQEMPFDEVETVIKFEPEKQISIVPMEYLVQHQETTTYDANDEFLAESYDNDNVPCDSATDVLECKLLPNPDEITIDEINTTKIWEKPPLNYVEMAVLAIMTSENMEMKIEEIYEFVRENFPYAQSNTLELYWGETLMDVVHCNPYIFTSRSSGESSTRPKVTCGIRKSPASESLLQKIQKSVYDKLNNLSTYMAFPERINSFQHAVMRSVVPECIQIGDADDSDTVNSEDVEHAGQSNGDVSDADAVNSSVANSLTITVQKKKAFKYRPPQMPRLTFTQLFALAVMTSENMRLSFRDIFCFIAFEFPFYRDANNWKDPVKSYIHNCIYVEMSEDEAGPNKCMYVVKCCPDYYRIRSKIYKILDLGDLSPFMSSPSPQGLIDALKNNLLRKNFNAAIVSEYWNGATNIGLQSKVNKHMEYAEEILQRMEITEEDLVKIEHQVWSASFSANLHNNSKTLVIKRSSKTIKKQNGNSHRKPVKVNGGKVSERLNKHLASWQIKDIGNHYAQSIASAIKNTNLDPAKVVKMPKKSKTIVDKSKNTQPIRKIPPNDITSRGVSEIMKNLIATGKVKKVAKYSSHVVANTNKPTNLLPIRVVEFPNISNQILASAATKYAHDAVPGTRNVITANQTRPIEEIILDAPNSIPIHAISTATINESSQDALALHPNLNGIINSIQPSSTACSSEESKIAESDEISKNVVPNPALVFLPRPVLSVEYMCILSILDTANVAATFFEIHSFIKENFPFYTLEMQPPCEFLIKSVLAKDMFTTIHHRINIESEPADGNEKQQYAGYSYGVRESRLTDKKRQEIACLLSCRENLISMAYPERALGFIKNVMTKATDEWRRQHGIPLGIPTAILPRILPTTK